MIVYMEVEGIISQSQSLKGKRSVIKSLITRIRKDFNVSISEIAYQNVWQRTMFGIAVVTNEYKYGEQVMLEIQKVIDQESQFERTITSIDRL